MQGLGNRIPTPDNQQTDRCFLYLILGNSISVVFRCCYFGRVSLVENGNGLLEVWMLWRVLNGECVGVHLPDLNRISFASYLHLIYILSLISVIWSLFICRKGGGELRHFVFSRRLHIIPHSFLYSSDKQWPSDVFKKTVEYTAIQSFSPLSHLGVTTAFPLARLHKRL